MAQPQAAPAAPAPPVVVVVIGLADLIPDSYSGDDTLVDIEENFARYRQWFRINQDRFANNVEQVVSSIQHCNGLMIYQLVIYLQL